MLPTPSTSEELREAEFQKRFKAITELLEQGLSKRKVANQLGLAFNTVKYTLAKAAARGLFETKPVKPAPSRKDDLQELPLTLPSSLKVAVLRIPIPLTEEDYALLTKWLADLGPMLTGRATTDSSEKNGALEM